MKIPSGFHPSSRRRDSRIGLLMQETGASQEIDTGVIQFQSGCLMMVKKLFVLGQSRSFKSFQAALTSLIFIEKILIILQFLQSKEKDNSREFQKYLTVGSSLDQCLSHKATIHLTSKMKSSVRNSQETSSQRVLIRPEDGFTL